MSPLHLQELYRIEAERTRSSVVWLIGWVQLSFDRWEYGEESWPFGDLSDSECVRNALADAELTLVGLRYMDPEIVWSLGEKFLASFANTIATWREMQAYEIWSGRELQVLVVPKP